MPAANQPTRTSRGGSRLLLPALVLPVLLALLSWTASYFFNVFNSDVTMPDWTVDLTLTAAEILSALRSAVLPALVACSAYIGKKIGRKLMVFIAISATLIELVTILSTAFNWVEIQFINAFVAIILWLCGIKKLWPIPLIVIIGSITNLLFGLVSTWLSEGFGLLNPLTLLTDLVLCAAAFLIGKAVRRRAERAKNVRERKKWGMRKAAVFAAVPAAILPTAYALMDLTDHLGHRSAYSAEVFAAGTAHFTGILVRRLLIYGVLGAFAAYLAASLAVRLLRRGKAGKPGGDPNAAGATGASGA